MFAALVLSFSLVACIEELEFSLFFFVLFFQMSIFSSLNKGEKKRKKGGEIKKRKRLTNQTFRLILLREFHARWNLKHANCHKGKHFFLQTCINNGRYICNDLQQRIVPQLLALIC